MNSELNRFHFLYKIQKHSLFTAKEVGGFHLPGTHVTSVKQIMCLTCWRIRLLLPPPHTRRRDDGCSTAFIYRRYKSLADVFRSETLAQSLTAKCLCNKDLFTLNRKRYKSCTCHPLLMLRWISETFIWHHHQVKIFNLSNAFYLMTLMKLEHKKTDFPLSHKGLAVSSQHGMYL